MTKEPHSLTVASDVANLEIVADFIAQAAQKANLDDQGIFAIQMAVDEACTNIIEHAYAGAPGDIHLTLDMADVSYISSSGLKVLLAALRQSRRQQGQLVLCNLQPKVASILEMIGFDQVFPIAQDLAAATCLLEQA